MRNIKLIIAYDGTDFCGWQRQRFGETLSARSVQGEIEKALEKIHKHPVPLHGSGRTDSGVHAAGQVANFHCDIPGMPAGAFVPALNSLLPADVRVLEAAEAEIGFHARFDAKARTYRYCFIYGSALPHETRTALRLWRQPDIPLLNSYCAMLRGETDCTVFAGAGDKSLSRKRYLYHAVFYVEGRMIIFEIKANAFLWKMVRSVAGTLINCDEKKAEPREFDSLLHSGDRSRAGPTLPPNGLFLWKIDY